MTPGLYLTHKPVGATSFATVRAFQEEAQATRPGRRTALCHGGTLDPFAEGLLLMLVGPATHLFEHLHAAPKVYEARVEWGTEMDTGDLHGRPVHQGDATALTPAQLEAALSPFLGWMDQIPPATSAKKLGGEPAYRKAHRGEVVELPPSRVYLHTARWLSHDLPKASILELTCRGGYYVRSLARDLGRALGCGAHLSTLKRTAIGPWKDPGPGARIERHGRDLLPWTSSRALTDQDVGALRQGQSIAVTPLQPPDWRLPPGYPEPPGPVRGFHQGKLTFLLTPRDGALWPETELRGGV
ncbi:tRNA pseudouridine(55) synthase TruB [Corallococcus exiguus]|uniref:tRNA pseudouridine(55) synthase TruB n=1 Tax=Corallococcus exiguus TaxID=83462 RepID=UPI001470B47B|nr:tRNA pseudouridine(55) synthase TruB [Corallococcus exiguus]NNB94304.1 tRNA pseudouridine(55) synthase TruB [Corallococcus exiguus]NNC02296.1 tRNA pseudouridine(55) synthase TruB [Corallococcus exiguus]